jgi:hypothetical protein
MSRRRFRGRVRVGSSPDPDRRRRDLPPTAGLDEHIEDFVGWMRAGGFSPEHAKRFGDSIRELHRRTGTNFLTLPPEEQLAFVIECDRQLDGLERQGEAEGSDVDSEEPEH